MKIIYFIIFFNLALVIFFIRFFRRRIEHISRYAKKLSEDFSSTESYGPVNGVYKELVRNIERIASKFRHETENANKEKNRIFAILESMAEGVIVIDSAQKIVMANRALGHLFGMKNEEILGKYYWEAFRDIEINQMIDRCFGQKVSAEKELFTHLPNRTFQMQASPVVGEGVFLGAVIVFYDLTRVKELERTRSEFVANVSHELKTPLTSIIGYVETLKDGAINDENNRLKFLSVIEDQSKKLHDLIEDLLLISKIESGKEVFKSEVIVLDDVWDGLLEIFDKALQAKKIRMTFEASPRPFVIQADFKSIERALSNLVDNAIKYNDLDGAITVSAFKEGDICKIEIADTGIGIAQDDRSRIFERFYRSEKSRSRESGGTGLGLAIVKHIIERHSGRIEVRPNTPKGTVFTIFLPTLAKSPEAT